MTLKRFSGFALLASAIFVAAYCPKPTPVSKDAILLEATMAMLRKFHYAPIKIDDEFSKKSYALYLERIDGRRNFLTQKDVDILKQSETKIDDEVNNTSFNFFEQSLAMLNAGNEKAEAYYNEAIVAKHDFAASETIDLGEKKPFAKDDNDLKDQWRKLIKSDILSRFVSKIEAKEEGKADWKDKSEAEMVEAATRECKKTYDAYFKRIKKQKRSDRLEIYINSIVNVFDPHTSYFEPVAKQNFDVRMSGRLIGIGARLQTEPETELTKITEVVIGGPAHKQKELQEGDLIMRVAQGDKEAVDVAGMEIDEVVSMIRGKENSEVRLTVKKKDGSVKIIPIVREEVVFDEGFAKSLILQADAKADKIGYIKLPSFYADFSKADGHQCAEDVRVEVEKLKKEGAKGIILDLRYNGGGSLRDVVEMAGMFIERGPIVQVKEAAARPQVMSDEDPAVQYNGSLIVMVNEYSASASEIMAAAMQDYGRAIIVGTKTHGKGTVQRFFDLDRMVRNDSIKPLGEVKITIQKFFRINGGSTQLRGVVPDIILPDNYMDLKTGEEEEDYPLAWTDIAGVSYEQKVLSFKKEKIVDASRKRIAKNATFNLITQNAKRLKENRERDVYALNLAAFRADDKKRREDNKKFEDILKPIETIKIANLSDDVPSLDKDASKKARNAEWLKDVKKDAHLYETLQIMRDLIENSNIASK